MTRFKTTPFRPLLFLITGIAVMLTLSLVTRSSSTQKTPISSQEIVVPPIRVVVPSTTMKPAETTLPAAPTTTVQVVTSLPIPETYRPPPPAPSTTLSVENGNPSPQTNSTNGPILNPSSNKHVQPKGCEASTTQVVSPGGKYWGKYQFDYQTWVAHGGSPSTYGNASEEVQDEVASRVKYDAWPNC